MQQRVIINHTCYKSKALEPMIARITLYLRTIFLSFYSDETYREVRYRWSGVGIGYFLTLCVVATLPLVLTMYGEISHYFDDTQDSDNPIAPSLEYIISQIPTMTITNDTINTKDSGVFSIVTENSEQPLVIIDTSNHYSSVHETNARILVTRDKILFLNLLDKENVLSVYDMIEMLHLNHSKTYIFDRQLATDLVREISGNVNQMLIYAFLVIVSSLFFEYSMWILVFSVIGISMAIAMRSSLGFAPALRLAAVSSTPLIIINTLGIWLGNSLFSNPTLVYFLMHCAYLYYALDASKNSPTNIA